MCEPGCFSCVWLCATLWTTVCQAPLSVGFSRQEYLSGLPCLPPGESSQPRDQTTVSYISCIGRRVLSYLLHLGRLFKVREPHKSLIDWLTSWSNVSRWIIWFSIKSARNKRRIGALKQTQSLSPPVLTTDSIHPHPAKNQKPAKFGFPWWYSGKESTCQCRGHRFDPCSGRIPRASNNQVRAPQLLKPCEPGACAPQQERPARWETLSRQPESTTPRRN